VLSATAGIVCRSSYFGLHSTYPQPAGRDFLGHLLRHFSAKLLVMWDGLPAHRAGVVSESIRAQQSRLQSSGCWAISSELNPVDYI